ncbi:DUF1361 domain-containing protein [Spongiivirga sp. MCCC 1A20706]|uniref:DUF1361 domain-containing protein n=1 Tax=Spongiivirga sp. MCCC 1A20706 TaxID=3160963 RepID=UPI003977C47E
MNTLFLNKNAFIKQLSAPLIIGFLFLGIRLYITRSPLFLFLVWNLVLATVPLFCSYVLIRKERWQKPYLFAIIFLVWLLFFPNAPYIITDFIHLEGWSQMPLWFDFILIGCFALAGLQLGLQSLLIIHENLKWYFTNGSSHFVVVACCLLSGYGVYLGRFVRLNSWEVITNPIKLTILATRSLGGINTWVFSLLFGGSILLAYYLYRKLIKID